MVRISSKELLKYPDRVSASYKVKPNSLIQYPENVKSPYKESLKNIDDGMRYSINYMGSGVDMQGNDISLGSNYFIEGSGECNKETSSNECKGKKRYVYVRNIPTGTIPPLNMSFYNATGCNLTGLTEGRGLVPGLIEDVYDFNPVEITRAMTKNGNIGSDVCKKMTLPVGSKIYDNKRENKSWTWETKCTSGHQTMTETTNKSLNNSVKNKNKTIKKARLPGPLQLRENFKGRGGYSGSFRGSLSVIESIIMTVVLWVLVFIKPFDNKYIPYVIYLICGLMMFLATKRIMTKPTKIIS